VVVINSAYRCRSNLLRSWAKFCFLRRNLDFIVTIFTCQSKNPTEGSDEALEALGIVSLVFSCLFMVELLASIWAFGSDYFKSKFHLFDAIVITASFIIDILLRGPLEEVASLIIVLRLWRVVKIIEELSVGAQEQMEDLQEKVQMLERENSRLKEEIKGFKERANSGGRS
jgi:voltage-gated hydrogen channel 1